MSRKSGAIQSRPEHIPFAAYYQRRNRIGELEPFKDGGGQRHAIAVSTVSEELQRNRLAIDLLPKVVYGHQEIRSEEVCFVFDRAQVPGAEYVRLTTAEFLLVLAMQ